MTRVRPRSLLQVVLMGFVLVLMIFGLTNDLFC